MARIFPERIARATRSAAERRLYELLRDDLDGAFSVYHGAPWLDKAEGQEPQDGEADFVVGHPDLGVMVMEVKGGRVSRNGAAGIWESRDVADQAHEITDPFEQVKREAYSLRHVAERLGDWPAHRVRFIRSVAFPDSHYDRALVPHGPAEMVIDERHLDGVGKRIREIFDWWSFSGQANADGGGLGKRGMTALETLLARSFSIPSPLRLAIDADEESIVQLTEHQFELLDFLRHQRHALITGTAGAGKTMLAAEHARRLSQQMTVLLLCVDRALARHLAKSVGTFDGIDVLTFNELSAAVLEEAHIEHTHEHENPAWWRSEGPKILRDSIPRLVRRYDAIVVDEAQDIDSSWWPPILDLLTDANRGIVYVFGDDNQDLYHGGFDTERGIVMPMSLPRFELHQNRRTTRSIHDFAQRFSVPLPEAATPISVGPPGRPVAIETYPDVEPPSNAAADPAATRECRGRLRRVLDTLAHQGKLRSEDIVILTPRWHRSWLVGPGASPWIGPFKLMPGLTIGGDVIEHPAHQQEIRVIRLQDFKGLEAKVVILAEIDGRIPREDLDALLYIGSTRARSHLVVIADEARARYVQDAPRST